MGMKDLSENLFVFDAIRPVVMSAAEYNVRQAGTLDTAAVIDLADYNYPKEILIQVVVGTVESTGTLNVDVESATTSAVVVTGTASTTDHSFDEITEAGVATYHYIPTKRYINVEATVANADVTFGITLVMGALGWGSTGQA